jgi:hypothetical protein
MADGGSIKRVHLLVRSRGGRWVDKWEALSRIGNVRVKTIPEGHPLYGDERIAYSRDVADHLMADDVLTGRHGVHVFHGHVYVVGRHAVLDEAAERLGGNWHGGDGVYVFPHGAEGELRGLVAQLNMDQDTAA